MAGGAKLKAWVSAARLRTLPLAASCVLTGSAYAWNYSSTPWTIFILCLTTCLLLQVLSNFANDYGDYLHGTDNQNRVGPTRAVQSGAISKEEMFRAITICASLALISGIVLLWYALARKGFWIEALVLFMIGLLCILAAYKYTIGKRPYGYSGFGDAAVFLFFGIVGVSGTAFLQSGFFDIWSLLPAAGIGLLSTAVLNLNNMRDIENDKASSKITLAVRIGFKAGKFYQYFLVIAGLVCLVSSFYWPFLFSWIFLILLIIPLRLLLLHLMFIARVKENEAIDPELKKVALATFFLALIIFISGMVVHT